MGSAASSSLVVLLILTRGRLVVMAGTSLVS